ncbi:NAD(P)/FAD-dependent oxidoreductase [Erythrobacter gaetbuli]|uniref:NAD(P)/FAD-dependent oxidoreductase n=1 Tax=Qipengyuania gaetbuli TaxID=266952 RepID=A0A844XZ85_9SPHN|nr:NAD(P)/FAD-dependent oxidoreductase [Qipengyuania gaetbuli]MXO50886.1 NAD(P)/FAD-dependent oxidoreductase [Qipengyuania gaetbuli]
MTDNILPTHRYDAVVVGARCAGAATAMLMARHGARVLMIDRAAEGSDTLSTHALMRGAVMQLHNWGVLHSITAENTPPIHRTSFIYGHADPIDIDLSDSFGTRALYAPRRTVLDRQLVRAAREAGVDTLFGVSMTGVVKEGAGRIKGVTIKGRQGTHTLACDLVIGADGRNSSLAKHVGAGLIKRGTNMSQIAFGYFTGLGQRGYRWYWGEDCGGGVIPTNDGEACVFLSAAHDGPYDLRGMRGADAFAYAASKMMPQMADELRGASLSGKIRCFGGQPGHMREACGNGWALVGDAGYFKDPITAHGITDALRDAQLLADSWACGRLDDYPAVRDALSHDIFRLSDEIAGYDMGLEGLAALHKSLNTAMQANQLWIAENLYATRAAA